MGIFATPAAAGTRPSAPPQPSVAVGNAQIVVTFVAPASDGGSPITRYAATCTSSDGGQPGDDNNNGAVSPITVGGLTNGRTYTCTVAAENVFDSSPPSPPSVAVIPSTVPDAPAQPTVSAGNAQVAVSFIPPFDEGRPYLSFTARCVSSNGGVANLVTAGGTTIDVTGLSNGKTYTCTAHATNVNGAGAESPPSVPVVPVSVPDTPARPTLAAGNMQIEVMFPPPFDNGSPIISYAASCTSTDGGEPGEMFAASPPLIVSSLTNGHTYTCNVSATSALGTSALSPDSLPAIPAQRPDRPAQPTVVSGNARVTVSFTTPAGNGFPVTSFNARCASSDGGITASHVGFASPIIVTGLTNAKTYTCTVSATNQLGAGPPSMPSVAVIPATIPAAPFMKVATSGNASLHVVFTPNGNNGRPITGYTATCTSSDGGAPASQTGTASPITVSPLTNGKTYTCRVSARNSIGPGGPSVASKAIVVGTPGAPTLLAVASGPAPVATGTVKVSFHAGADNASPVTSYRAICRPVTTGITRFGTSAASPIVVAGVLTSHAYRCSVVATNAFGTSVESSGLSTTVGTPAAPRVVATFALRNGLAIAFVAPADNGQTIKNYRARCASSDGGVPASPVATASPIVVTHLTGGKTYSCLLPALNVRGESPAAKAGPIVVHPPLTTALADCSGHLGSMKVSPGLTPSQVVAHTYTLSATYGACTGPYVRGAQIALTFHSAAAYSCANAIGKLNIGSGTITWTAPFGMGKSTASLSLTITGSSQHYTTVTFSGAVTTPANIFTDTFVSGTVTFAKGANTEAGGDCTAPPGLVSLPISATTLTLS